VSISDGRSNQGGSRSFVPCFSSHSGGVGVGLCEEQVLWRLLTRYVMRARVCCCIFVQLFCSAVVIARVTLVGETRVCRCGAQRG